MLAHLKQIPKRTNSLIIHPHIKAFIGFNFLAYGAYKLSSGPTKNSLRKNFVIEAGSSPLSVLTSHLLPVDIFNVLGSSALLYTVGNRHIWKYGPTHFWRLAIIGAIGGSLIAKTYAGSEYSGTIASSSAIVLFNALRNPAWFWFGSFPALAALMAYSVYYQDRGAAGGALAGYVAFLLAL
mmetsp:Transcript_15291/g.17010  ORF Transcript_15291/g.17010 Transcript_15291/m.17010 type:complete len:181 (-) Transcript_15291:32-574(-)